MAINSIVELTGLARLKIILTFKFLELEAVQIKRSGLLCIARAIVKTSLGSKALVGQRRETCF